MEANIGMRSTDQICLAEGQPISITPIKAAIVRKHSKQLPTALLRSRSGVGQDGSFAATGPKQPMSRSPAPAGLCSSLPDDLICKVTSFLDVASLQTVRICSHHLRDLATRNEAGWEDICRRLWAGKVHIPTVPPTPSPVHFMEAYYCSIRDARERQNLTLEELCYDPEQHTGTIWSFRFKESAGTDWTTADPWHCGLPCRKMVLLKDGSVQQYLPAPNNNNNLNTTPATATTSSGSIRSRSSLSRSASETSDSESSLPELVSPNFGRLLESQHPDDPEATAQQQQQQPLNGRLVPPSLAMSWRLLTRPMDLPTRPVGSYVRFSVGGREVPTYSVRRSPTGNWGFVMESCWGLYASFEMPPKRREAARGRRRLRRTETGARWVELLDNGEETLSSSSEHSAAAAINSHSTQAPDPAAVALMGDSSLVITNEIQWREAFLYNVGARILPEGEDATDEFDRAFRGIP